jgi:hypothetical protein
MAKKKCTCEKNCKCKKQEKCNCNISGGCSCGFGKKKGGGNLEEISVPLLLLLAKHGMDTVLKTPKKGGNLKKKTIKDVRRRVI